MFIAHIPAGYLTAATAQRLGLWTRGLMASSIVGAHFPDVDLAYCYFIDDGRVHHHLYWTHFPVAWLVLLLLSLAACWWTRARAWAIVAVFFTGSAFIHIMLDAVAGDVPLLAPWDMHFYSCFTVEARYETWWLNFFFHWTMLLELAIVFAAAFVFLRRLHHSRRRRHTLQA